MPGILIICNNEFVLWLLVLINFVLCLSIKMFRSLFGLEVENEKKDTHRVY
jgi:hypothetical protein